VSTDLAILPFDETHAGAVRDLFIAVNRLLAPAGMRDAFEAYIEQSLREEMGRITEYYRKKDGGFWIALRDGAVVGMFGLERTAPDAMELRRMYVDPAARRLGIGRALLRHAEARCREFGARRLELSTSELQPEALALYPGAGFHLMREAAAEQMSNKTVGAGIRRFYFDKEV
jgi:GNAT superfamily N-acetyltransferase